MIYGYLGKSDVFDRAVGTFAKLYADQTERDSKLFLDVIESGESKAVKEKQYGIIMVENKDARIH